MEEQGILKIRVFTSVAQIPVEGATVVVTAPGGRGKRRLLSVQLSDQNGQVRPVRVDTPRSGESVAPNGQDAPRPFAIVSVWAEHHGYAMLKAEDVQVFPGVETVQDMELIPLGEDEYSLEKREGRPNTAQNL